MFFSERIKNILPTDKVLEIGPGADPHPRADVLLEKKFLTDDEFYEQRGKTIITNQFLKPIFYYEGNIFPFKDNEFDYVICSHVLEHVEDIDIFIKEITRISKKGYLEFPTIYYDYLYNFDVHITYVFFDKGNIYWMPKKESSLANFKPVQKFFYRTLDYEYFTFINEYKKYFFQGFEWESSLKSQRVRDLNNLCYSDDTIINPIKEECLIETNKEVRPFSMRKSLKYIIKNIFLKIKKTKSINENGLNFKNALEKFRKMTYTSTKRFQLNDKDLYPCLNDNSTNTSFDSHYLYHTAWAARVVRKINPDLHIDISSYLYFSTIVSAFIPVEFYDIRPANIELSDLEVHHADLCNLPFESNSIHSLSCMHVVEHIGLGRYGDPLDYDGDLKAMAELARVLAKGGNLLFVVPIGSRPIIQFNAHRIYTKEQIVDQFINLGLSLKEFVLIPENETDRGLVSHPSQQLLSRQQYACGCFWFKK